jgi:Tfp pilus assembly protein PilF
MNLRVKDGWLKMDYCAVSLVHDTLSISLDNQELISKKLDLKPLEVVRDSIRWTGEVEKLTIKVGDEIIADGQPTATQRPLVAPKEFDWNSDYGLFLKAKDFMNQRKYAEAETTLQKLLKKSPSYTPALTLSAELAYFMGIEDASQLLTEFALQNNTYDAKANFIAGISNAHFGSMAVAKDRLATASLDPVYRSAALYHLAKIAVKEKNYLQALTLVEQSLESQNENWNAKELEIIVLRMLNLNGRALLKAKEVLHKDPLNHLARFEIAQITKNDLDRQGFMGMIKSELPAETYLEFAINYADLGLYKASLEVLSDAPQNPIVSLWKSYLYDKINMKSESAASLNEVITMSCEGVFPFRNETASVLTWAIKQKQHWKLLYYHHLTSASYRPEAFIEVEFGLIDAPKLQSDFVPYYLYKAEVLKKEKGIAKASLEKAYEIAPQNWRVVKALADFYASNGELKKALNVNESKLSKSQGLGKADRPLPEHEVYILGQQRAQILAKMGRYKEAIDWMKSLHILPNEGASAAHGLFREINIRYAAELTKNKKLKEAQVYLNEAETWPENLGSGEPYDPDNRLTAYLKKMINLKIRNKPADAADLLILTKTLSASDFALLQLFE